MPLTKQRPRRKPRQASSVAGVTNSANSPASMVRGMPLRGASNREAGLALRAAGRYERGNRLAVPLPAFHETIEHFVERYRAGA
jgi:hypothetical protein